MATLKDVAKEAGVGLGTASRALSGIGSISSKSYDKVMAAAKKLDFVPNQVARNLKKQTTGCVALAIPVIFHPFFSKLAFCCENQLYKYGYRLIIVNSQDDKKKETTVFDMIKQQRVDGIIICTHYTYEGIDPTLPIVTIDGQIHRSFPCVTCDNYNASYNAVKRLYDSGARKIGCVSGTTESFSETSYRFQAYCDCIEKLGLEQRLIKTNFKHGVEGKIVADFLEAFPDVDAVFAASDVLALILCGELKKLGRRVPEDVQVIGFDGVVDSSITAINLSTIVQNVEQMAKIAVDLLLDRINGVQTPERIQVEAAFKLGDTTLGG